MLKTALIQINSIVGALKENADTIIKQAHIAADNGAQLILFPELALSGYPPEDLILKDHFTSDCACEVERLKAELPKGATILFGTPTTEDGKRFNTALAIKDGMVIGHYNKMCLPNYGVFDEYRIFEAGTKPLILEVEGYKVAVHICEDSWITTGPAVALLKEQELDLIVNLSASPYHRGKLYERFDVLAATTKELNAPLLYCNLIGGQDELVFDGASMVVLPDGTTGARAKQFDLDILYYETNVKYGRVEPLANELEEIYCALKLGLSDYINKNHFKRVVVALSGGIDSAIVLALAVDALGADRVAAVTMPSQFSSEGTLNDAIEMAANLGVEFYTLPIKSLYESFSTLLSTVWGKEKSPGLAEENLQARIRGNLIMALSNEYGWIVLTTGNKSEMAMGYCTIYGDMAGGFAVIKDVPKTLVFDLCRWRNQQSESPVIPPTIITRPPSAELREDQKDTDSLPPYEELDPVLADYVENDLGIESLITKGYDEAIVRRVVRAVELSEYKRRQSPPGIKITPKSFGRDRRIPITNRYRN